MKIWSTEPLQYFFWMGNRLAFDLLEISHDPARLSDPGFWAVTTTFEGRWTCARFGQVIDAPFPADLPQWIGLSGEWSSTFTQGEYVDYVQSIKNEIAQGNVYQVNACREISIATSIDSLAGLMADILKFNPAPFASFLRLPDLEIASASPELLFNVHAGLATSGPIKGTKSSMENDSGFGEKDVAENIMIVDLIRNDLGKICEIGSVSVPHLLETQIHPGLSHLVSFISGRLREDLSWQEIADSILPPGSVSGAPKSSAVSIISQREERARGPYCGALGWVEDGSALLSVAIRIFWLNRDGVLRFGTGAGITWGSDAESEWLETELKAARLMSIARGDARSTM